uniref:histone-lysine N-methyltransferase 2D-like n=1 Tax=Solea senegalensis TaxID=28829 RepID=UPI001CD89ECE|nr:histone-lysine N-methyltransferase 2D-like [Solea senegalensis]
MPSEAQSQEPRDRGPPPPVTRAGRSAQLAKAAATSLTSERRSRGRPRKDGSGGHSAPSPSPPPPAPKSKTKGRSRGRAQVEDEESMEKKLPHKTDLKEVNEKTTGRQRSTSRKKSTTNPEPEPDPDPEPAPSQDCLSSQSKLEADLEPPLPDLTVPESGPEPVHSTEVDSRTSPGPGDKPQLPTSSLDHSPVQNPASDPSPAPDPVKEEEDIPTQRYSPTPPEVAYSPSRVSMETEGGGASPMDQSPALSPCCSLPVSPCPQLEDEDPVSPLFQTLSDDPGGSPTPSLGHAQKHLKQCAFCYRGDDPPLGQGRLVVFGPTPGYIPLHILNRRASSDRDSDCHDHCYRGGQAPPSCSSPEQGGSSSEFLEQLGLIGLPHDINVQSLFDPTGQCCAHLQCAAWSEGVCRGEGQSLLYVDKAIDSGSTQVCVFCHRLGASLRCQEPGCGRHYHFPCAAAAGAHQDWSQTHTLCTRHTHTVSPQCVLCSGDGDVISLLMCCCCGNYYHGSCLDPPLSPSPLLRVGWQCPECRVCQSCRLRGEDDGVLLLVCERCDKAYHPHCLTPALDHMPSSGWKCKSCRICRCCGVRSSGQWANHPFLCKPCDPALPCPVCGRTHDLYTPQQYLTCTSCHRCVHTECFVQTGEGRAGSESYICSTCRSQEEDQLPNSLVPCSPTPVRPISSTPIPPMSMSQPSIHSLIEGPPLSPTTQSPVLLTRTETPQSQSKTMGSPSQYSLKPCHPDSSEVQLSPRIAHIVPLELNLSPAHTRPDSSELQQSPSPMQPDSLDLQQSPAPIQPDPSERRQSPAPTQPDSSELQQSLAPIQPDPLALQQSPATTQPDSSELQQSPAPTQPHSSELQQSPAPTQPDSSELQQRPAPTQPDSSELQQGPAPTQPDSSELQQSPAPIQPDSSELQQSPAPTQPDPLELQQGPAPTQPDPLELQQGPAPTQPDSSELQQSLSPLNLIHQSSNKVLPTQPDPLDLQQAPAPTQPDPLDLQQTPTKS